MLDTLWPFTCLIQISWISRILASSNAIDGGWSVWSSWTSECSEQCGEGFHTRWRYCDNPTPASGGSNCLGSNIDKTPCNLKHCSRVGLSANGESCTLHCFNKGMNVCIDVSSFLLKNSLFFPLRILKIWIVNTILKLLHSQKKIAIKLAIIFFYCVIYS